ncbi:MAG: TraR/DksA C4-type zinc finger protein [Thermoflexales bacterium]|nr:TraR/DksA C4-type zinc finger protein [Thermoflexales bacterium]
MTQSTYPRSTIEFLIREGNVQVLLLKAGELHGHFCPFLALGVRAGLIAMRALGVQENPGMEDVVAILECNNCFSDGVQVVTGCTFGNNALIYRDVGKTAFTLARRDGTAVRVALRAEFVESFRSRLPEEANALFRKIVQEHEEATPEERARLTELWTEASFRQLELPEEEVFTVQHLRIEVPPRSRIFASVRCAICGESVMETRARIRDGQPVCIPCARDAHYRLDGYGISVEG